ncbi:hypothetical protein C0991_007134 [Blastosporella zonata]|nr:hypothetical protein C0991_007134 [Blastosporella zonata]
MVKRAKSPDTAEDEKYFTVYQPYPLNANWELPSDYIAFCRWIAACIGTDPIHALHYKPSARGMVLIEVDKKYSHNERLLGEHRWEEFLRRPTQEETDKVTQIFHSLYTTGREAQKDGWKRIHVEAPWFKGWSPTNDFVDNYPATYWCPTPAEDRTNKPLCRPLPVNVKPPPPKTTPFIPGSSGWVSAKAAPSQNTPGAQKNAWDKGRKTSINIPSAPAWNKPITSSAPSPVQPTSSTTTTAASTTTSTKAPPHPKSVCESYHHAFSTKVQKLTQKSGNDPPKSATASPTSPTSPPAFPPGLNIRPSLGQSFPTPPGLTKRLWSDDVDSNASGSGPGSFVDTEKALSEALKENVTISSSPRQDRQLSDFGPDQSPELDQYLHSWEKTSASTYDIQYDATNTASSESLWGDDSGPKGPEVPAQCPHHQHSCKKGVCQWRAKQVKEKERLDALTKKNNQSGWGKGGLIPVLSF